MKSITVTELRGVKRTTIEEIAPKIAIQRPAGVTRPRRFPEVENRGHPGDFPGLAVSARLEEANNARGAANPRALPTRPVIPGGGEGGTEGVRPHHR